MKVPNLTRQMLNCLLQGWRITFSIQFYVKSSYKNGMECEGEKKKTKKLTGVKILFPLSCVNWVKWIHSGMGFNSSAAHQCLLAFSIEYPFICKHFRALKHSLKKTLQIWQHSRLLKETVNIQ